DEPAGAAPFVATAGVLRLAVVGAIALNALFSLIELWRAGLFADTRVVRYAAIATAATIALHLRHVAAGLKGERPRAGAWTLGVLVIVNAAAAVLVGRFWGLQFASLAVSALIVVRGPAGPLAVAAIALSPLVLGPALEAWRIAGPFALVTDWYLVLAIAWRTVTLYVPIQLVARIRQLEAARAALESRAVIETRSRIETDLRSGLEVTLQRVIADGESARLATRDDSARASAKLRALVADSRRALADARRIVGGYRTASLRGEVDAALSLLQAAGSTCRVVVAENVPIDDDGTVSGGAIRAAVVRALEDDDHTVDRVISVALDAAGQLRVEMTP
ncbi:MAG TPA: hypothetical protein VKE51_23810, partial [Vicinamibacterales bacterium]|nr:hypothetical protein [Vicinamibacterales bacterium]